jgi:hypothetical protein
MPPGARPDRMPVMTSVVSHNYLGMVGVLVASYLEHNPGGRAVILVIDGARPDDVIPGAELISPQELSLSPDDVAQMALAYDVLELATALKPYLLATLLERHQCPIVYLDADVFVTGSFDEIARRAAAHQIVLTPHVVTPFPRDGHGIDELTIQLSGVFNLGFVAVGPGAEPFLDWWAERTRWDALVSPEQGLFTDQRWIDQVPALFDHHVARDRGWNIAYWNAHERPLSRDEQGRLLADGDLVRFFHFSGYSSDAPHLLSKYQGPSPRVLLSEHPLLREVCEDYRMRLVNAGHPERQRDPYAYASVGGAPIPTLVRRMARASMLAGGDDVAPTPWTPEGEAAFIDWLNRPVATVDGSVLTRLVLEVWAHRMDLQVRLTDPMGADLPALLEWADRDEDFKLRYGHLHQPWAEGPTAGGDVHPVDAAASNGDPESPRRVEAGVSPVDLAGRLERLEHDLHDRDRLTADLQHSWDLRLAELLHQQESQAAEVVALQEELYTISPRWLRRWSVLPRRVYAAWRRHAR